MDDVPARAALRTLRTMLDAHPASDANYGLIHWNFCDDDLALLPPFMLMSNLLIYASLLIIVEEGRDGAEAEWVGRLRQRVQGKIKKYRKEFELGVTSE